MLKILVINWNPSMIYSKFWNIFRSFLSISSDWLRPGMMLRGLKIIMANSTNYFHNYYQFFWVKILVLNCFKFIYKSLKFSVGKSQVYIWFFWFLFCLLPESCFYSEFQSIEDRLGDRCNLYLPFVR